MFNINTNHPVAVDSDDHKYPEGIYKDNSYNQTFVDSVNAYFNGTKLQFMDLGCAGGELVCRLVEQGHNAIGLEGSDHCLNVNQQMVKSMGQMPSGYKNWETYGLKNLFTCDVTKPFEVLFNDSPFKCDLITCFDVIEHFEESQLEQYFVNVNNHLKPDGLFTASIHIGASGNSTHTEGIPENLNYHKTMRDRDWWINILSNYFKVLDTNPLGCSNRGHSADHPELYTCKKK